MVVCLICLAILLQEISYNLNRQTGFIMIAETISLGILSLPSVIATVGLVA